jgi:protein TonB
LFQSRPVPATPFVAWVRTLAGRRARGFGLAVLIEALLIVLLLTLGREVPPGVEKEHRTEVTFITDDAPREAPAERRPEPERPSETRPETQRPESQQPRPPQPAEPAVAPATPAEPVAPGIIPMRWSLAPANPLRANDRPAPPSRPVYGPVDTRSAAMRDSEPVGTAPNGEPLYAAEWYRQPAADMMRSYLSTARGPGWGLIACRTAPDYRVEDCVALDEYPDGSQITRSALAAAWEFRVRPPRRGGRPLVGSWVRIRIDYSISRR